MGRVYFSRDANRRVYFRTVSPHLVYYESTLYKNYSYIDAGFYHSIGLEHTKLVGWSWGLNDYGQLGVGDISNRKIPYAIKEDKTFAMVAGGYKHTIAIDNNGYLFGWGYNKQGQLGILTGSENHQCSPIAISISEAFREIAAGRNFTLASDMSNKAYSWGENTFGQLGLGDTVDICTPTAIGPEFRYLSAGNYHSLGITENGIGWAWGGGNINSTDNYGQLGNNSNQNECTPVQIYNLTNICKISAGMHFSLAIDSDGNGWSWGAGTAGKLGNNDTVNYSTPVAIYGGHTFCEISAGGHFSLAIDYNGVGWAWGDCSYGALGNNTSIESHKTPISIWGNHTFCKIAAGFGFSLAIDNNYSLWAWGDNSSGQLGNDTIQSKLTPILIR